ERIRRIEQLAEVAAPHGERRYGRRVRQHSTVVHPFLRAEEEELVGEETARYRPTKRVSVLFVFEWRRTAVLARVRAAVARPCIGLQLVGAEKIRPAAGVVIAAALGDEPDLAAARAAVFRH